MNPKVLIVDRDGHNRHRLAQRLRQRGCRVALAEGLAQGEKFIRRRKADVVVLDLRSLGDEALVLLQIINRTQPAVRSILLTSPAHIPLSIAGMQLGAFDDLMAPVDVDHLLERLRAALESTRRRGPEIPPGPVSGANPALSQDRSTLGGRDKMEDFKILLVDDEEDFLDSLTERMGLRDLKADTARSGEEALQRVQTDEPTVIVLDLRMPGMDGLEVLRRVKKAHPRVQVVILTGHGTDKDKEQAKKLGAFAYLQKPVDLDTLLETVKRAHQRFKAVKHSVDTAFMAAAIAQAGEVEAAQEIMREEKERRK